MWRWGLRWGRRAVGIFGLGGSAAFSVAALLTGYLVEISSSYNAPFVPMKPLLVVGALL